jgi:hypothetical protein
MAHAFKLADTVRLFSEVHGVFIGTEKKISTHTGCEVDDDIHFTVANAPYNLPKKVCPAAGLAGVRIPDMEMDDGCSGLCRLNCGAGNFLRRDRYGRMLPNAVPGPGHSTTDYNFAVHLPIMPERAQVS